MGTLIKAVCSCGYASKVMQQGIGFAYFDTGDYYEPAYCDQCGEVRLRNRRKRPRCGYCRKRMHFYFDDVGANPVPSPDDLVFTNYLEQKELWHCPACKQETLRFEQWGTWD
jgi:hypothetical protein